MTRARIRIGKVVVDRSAAGPPADLGVRIQARLDRVLETPGGGTTRVSPSVGRDAVPDRVADAIRRALRDSGVIR